MDLINDVELINRIYRSWKLEFTGTVYFLTALTYQGRRYRDQRFEDWLWQQGFTVVQKDKKRYLKFHGNPAELTLFLLGRS